MNIIIETGDSEVVKKFMKTRVVTAVGIILFVIGIIFVHDRALGVAMFFLSLMAVREYIKCFEKTTCKPIKVVLYMSTLGMLPLTFMDNINVSGRVVALLIYCFIVLLASVAVIKNIKYGIIDVAVTLFGMFYIPFLFSFITLTRLMQNGIYYIWIIFIGSSATDTCAYFVGVLFGKNKLIPNVSPKKTIEGSIGGIVGTIVIMSVYGKYLMNMNVIDVPVIHFVVLGFVTSIVSQVGDLFASTIKRFVGVKDYSNILPGHGGILDRFDSIMFIAPMIYFYIKLVGGV